MKNEIDGKNGLGNSGVDPESPLEAINTATGLLLSIRNSAFINFLEAHSGKVGLGARGVLGGVSLVPSIIQTGGYVLAKEYDLALHSTGKIVASIVGAKIGAAGGAALSPTKAVGALVGGSLGAVLGPSIYDLIKEHVGINYVVDSETKLAVVEGIVAGQVASLFNRVLTANQISQQNPLLPSHDIKSSYEYEGIPATTGGHISAEEVIILVHNIKVLWQKQEYIQKPLADLVKKVDSIIEQSQNNAMPPAMYEFMLKSAAERCIQDSAIQYKELLQDIEEGVNDIKIDQNDQVVYNAAEANLTIQDLVNTNFQENGFSADYYLNNINIAQTTDTSWLDFLTPAELAQLMTADASGLSGPSGKTFAELRMVAEARMAEQTANLDKTTGETNIVDPTDDGVLNLPEGWEQADYAMIQAVLAAQKDGDASAPIAEVTDLQDISEEIARAELIDQLNKAYNSAMVSAGNSAYGIYNSALSGDGLAMAKNTVNLITSIDQAVDSYLKLEGGGDGFLSKEISEALGDIGAGLNFAGDLIELTESIGSGDADETYDIIDYRLAA